MAGQQLVAQMIPQLGVTGLAAVPQGMFPPPAGPAREKLLRRARQRDRHHRSQAAVPDQRTHLRYLSTRLLYIIKVRLLYIL